MKKHACPHCHELTFSTWRKSSATSVRPMKCSKCHQLSYCSSWAHASIIFTHEFVFWVVILIALTLRSLWVLLLYPIIITLLFILNYQYFPLKETTLKQVAVAKKSLWKKLGIILLLVILGLLLFKR